MGVQPSYEICLAPDRSRAALVAVLGPLRIPLPMGAAEIHPLIDGLTSAAELLIVAADPPVPSPAGDLLAESIGRIESGAVPFLPAEACCGDDCGDCRNRGIDRGRPAAGAGGMSLPDFLKPSASEQSAELVRGGPADGRIVRVGMTQSTVNAIKYGGGYHKYKRTDRKTAGGHVAFEYQHKST